MTSVRDRIAAFSRGRVAPVEEAEAEAEARGVRVSRHFDASPPPPPTTTTARDASRVEATVTVDDARASTRGPTRARADDEAASGRDDVGTARATAFERASDALALARAVEATLRRERVFEDAERRARVRVEAAERAYEAVARRRAPGDDGGERERKGRGDAQARSSGRSRADASTASVVRSFSFARADEEASDDEEVTPGARDGSFSAYDHDGDDAVAAVRDIDAARRKIARLLKSATEVNASKRSETQKPSRRDRFELELSQSASLRRELARDRVAMLDSILAALAVDDE